MSGECDKCGEHTLECKCGIGCDAFGSKITKFSLRPLYSIPLPEKNYSLFEMIEMAKNSEYGVVWYSDKGPIQITKDGKLKPI